MGANKFTALVPKNDVDISSYQDAIDFALEKDDVRNIAVSGAYGSGKSSVINSYESVHKEKRFIHISLAHFKESDGTKEIKASGEINENNSDEEHESNLGVETNALVNKLEGKILNQLIHQIEPDRIPLSHFNVKSHSSKRKAFFKAIAALIFATIVVCFIKFDSWCDFFAKLNCELPEFLTRYHIKLVLGIIILGFVGIIVYRAISTQTLKSILKKIELKGVVGIELFEKDNNSYFDKYLNEVLYLFEHSGADAIVFEDLDRYEATIIFEKLREISSLLYARKMEFKGEKHDDKLSYPKFFYLLRDDVFLTSERTKFFDFIIPIIPVADTSNSSDKLIEQFKNAGIESEFSIHFLQDMSLYLSDMRIVENVVNEYMIYHERLANNNLPRDADHQLAMLIYKNLFPKDFSLLQQQRGYVNALLNKKAELLETRKNEIKQKLKTYKDRLEESKEEELVSIDELNALFFDVCDSIINVDDKPFDATQYTRTEMVAKLMNSKTIKFRNSTSGTYFQDTAELIRLMQNNEEYKIRKQRIEDKGDIQREKLITTIKDLEYRQSTIGTKTLSELIENIPDDDGFWKCTLPNCEAPNYLNSILNDVNYSLLKYLVRYGYIGEDYAIYSSYFYANSLTSGDRSFLLALRNHSELNAEYKLDNPHMVFSQMRESDFVRLELANYDLMEYMLINRHTKELRIWFNTFDKMYYENEAMDSFAIDFWRQNRSRKLFELDVCKLQPTWLKQWTNDELLTEEEWRLFVSDMLAFATEEVINKINDDGWLEKTISNTTGFLEVNTTDVDEIITSLERLSVRFKKLDYKNANAALLEGVYSKNLYELNSYMVNFWMEYLWGESAEDIAHRNYTIVLKHLETPLSERIHSNMFIYAQNMLADCDNYFSDTESAAIAFLNNADVEQEQKFAYIQALKTIISDINSIKDTNLWKFLIERKLVNYSWQNIATCHLKTAGEEDAVDKALASFINSNNQEFSWTMNSLVELFGEEGANKLYCAILKSQDISIQRYEAMIKPLNHICDSSVLSSLNEEQIVVLIRHKLINMTKENVALISQKFPNQFSSYVAICGQNRFIELLNKNSISLAEGDAVSLLESSAINMSTKQAILESYEEDLPILNKKYPVEVKTKIINVRHRTKEFSKFIECFNSEPLKIQNEIINFAYNYWAIAYDAIVQAGRIPVQIYSKCLSVMNENQAYELRKCLPTDFEVACSAARKIRFPMTDDVKVILDYFVKKEWISSYSIDDGRYRTNYKRKLFSHV